MKSINYCMRNKKIMNKLFFCTAHVDNLDILTKENVCLLQPLSIAVVKSGSSINKRKNATPIVQQYYIASTTQISSYQTLPKYLSNIRTLKILSVIDYIRYEYTSDFKAQHEL